MMEKLRLWAATGRSAAPACASSAAMHGRGASFMRATPSATSARLPASMGMRSATVPSVARSV